MNPNEYQKLAARTECDQVRSRERIICRESYVTTVPIRLVHAHLGISKEAGEFGETLQNYIYYGKSLDEINLKEELGDILWHVAQACNVLDLKMEDVMEANIAKLRQRFPDKYTDHDEAEENRDREAERKIIVEDDGPTYEDQEDEILEPGFFTYESAKCMTKASNFMCPHCKNPVNDDTAQNILTGTIRRGLCPQCLKVFTYGDLMPNG